MSPIQFNKLFSFLENDVYVYILPKKGRFVKESDILNRLVNVVEKLDESSFLRVNINMRADYSFNLQNVVLKRNKCNSFLLRRATLDSVLNECEENLDTLLNNKLLLLCGVNRFKNQEKRKEESIVNRAVNLKRKQITFATKKTSKHLVEWADDTKKKLENASTKYERMLYNALVKTFKKRIKRQHPFLINNHLYYADIAIPSLKLIIEVDGVYHNTKEQVEKDKLRDEDFQSVGYKTLRFSNGMVSSKKGKQEIIKQILGIANLIKSTK